MAAGAEGDEVVLVAERMIAQKSIKPATANAIIAELRAELA